MGSTLTAHKVDRVVNAPRENGDDYTEGEEKEDTKSEKPEPAKSTEKKAELSKIEPAPATAEEPAKKRNRKIKPQTG